MSMMISAQYCPYNWKIGEVVTSPKPVGSKEEKLLQQNWRPITLMVVIYMICFGMITNYFQEISHSRTSNDKRGIVVPNQKGFIRGKEGYSVYTSKIAMLLSHAKNSKKLNSPSRSRL
jgi:hypothetical protein